MTDDITKTVYISVVTSILKSDLDAINSTVLTLPTFDRRLTILTFDFVVLNIELFSRADCVTNRNLATKSIRHRKRAIPKRWRTSIATKHRPEVPGTLR